AYRAKRVFFNALDLWSVRHDDTSRDLQIADANLGQKAHCRFPGILPGDTARPDRSEKASGGLGGAASLFAAFLDDIQDAIDVGCGVEHAKRDANAIALGRDAYILGGEVVDPHPLAARQRNAVRGGP
ncbi:hypothetical protein, partial [Mesorhizobium sp. M0040]|uniref:hypothetical protein n=1 Tax=Mesorhizobium sp. M0040 TaxID=2956855 RepID=UPI00333D72A8